MESAFFTVADWVANPRSNSIRRKNRRSVLPPRLMDLLFYFCAASYGGRFQTRDH